MRVIKRFNDRLTRKRYEVGQDYDGPRVSELQAKGFLESPRPQSRRKRSMFQTQVSDESRETGSSDNAEAQD